MTTPEGQLFAKPLQMRLRWLIINHPEEEIFLDLHDKIETGEISINFQSEHGAGDMKAAFQTAHRSTIAYADDMSREWYPMLVVNPMELASIETEQDAIVMMLVIYHEYQHYKQYLRDMGAKGVEHARWGMTKESEMTREAGAHLISLEWEAYERECMLAARWDFDLSSIVGSMCDYTGSPEMGQYIFHATVKNAGGYTNFPRPYMAGMAEAAGHPQPDVYLN